jgi:GntR family transcriptional regulator/GntR family frlABCD operon transcriptional regulator
MASSSKALPQHKRLYEILRNLIMKGHYPEGSLLPSENELCSIHNLTRPTVRQALSRLAAEGYIMKHQGKGSIVRSLPKGIGILSIEGTTSGVGKHNLETIPTGKPRVEAWPKKFPFDLPQEYLDAGCIILERKRIVDGTPVLYDISYIPNMNLPRFLHRRFENRSLFDVLRANYQVEVVGGQQRIMAVKADRRISRYLRIQPGNPALHLLRRMETNRPGFVFFSSIYCNTDSFYLEGTF